jgi:hypothetical protein
MGRVNSLVCERLAMFDRAVSSPPSTGAVPLLTFDSRSLFKSTLDQCASNDDVLATTAVPNA